MERDMYGSQKRIWKMLRKNKLEIKDTVQTNKITIEEWKAYFERLYEGEESKEEQTMEDEDEANDEIEVTEDMVAKIIKQLKNRKSPGPDNITNEMLKYGGQDLHKELTKLFRNILNQRKIPGEWKESITIPIFKKGQQIYPENYRGITLLNSTLKAFTRLVLEILSQNIQIREEQQGFRRNRSTIDAIYILKQITEKSLEFNKPAFMCFVDMTRAFDRVRLADAIAIMKEKEVNERIIRIVQDINENCKTTIKVGHQTTEEIKIKDGIRQGDSLSPFIFNLIMDKITESLPKEAGYKMGNTCFHVVCYADDAVLIADSEDNLQKLLHAFNQKAKQFNMSINTGKTQCMVTAKEPTRCKLEIEGKIVEQVMRFNYLGAEMTSNGNLQQEVRKLTMKATRISGCLKDIIWRNKYLEAESKIRIYKTAIRPVMTYAAETRADTSRTVQLMRTAEMKVIRTIHGKTIHDRIRNEDLLEASNIQDVAKFVRHRRKCWKKHVDRMDNNRLVKNARQNIPTGKRTQGRPSKRWKDCWTSTSEEV